MNELNQKEFYQLRQQIIRQEFSQMNDRQQEAVFTVKGPVLVLAGAGSGKTTVIVNRIANIIRFGDGYQSRLIAQWVKSEDVDFLKYYVKNEQHTDEERSRAQMLCAVEPARPWNIIAITFTNKAADELKERLSAMLGPEDGNAIWASTFHSACVRILRRDIERLGFSRNFTIYDIDDSLRVMKDCMKEQNVDEKHFHPRGVLSAVSQAKNELKIPEDCMREAGSDFRKRVIASLYAAYQKKIQSANALDFDDIIMKTVILLRSNQDVLDYYQKKFCYVMVDEYQDTNYSQYILVSLLAGGYENICVVGDDDQSIYRFRGATIENILNFEKQFENTHVVRLEQNYRSTKPILAAANEVIAKNTTRKPKTLWTNNPGDDKIVLYQALDDRSEAMYIANTIFDMVKKEGRKYSDFAVLYRVNAQHVLLKQTFFKMGLPHRIIKGNSLFDSKEFKDIRAYLCVIANCHDDARLKRIINEPKRGIGASTVDLVEALGTSLSKSMYEICGLSMQIDPLQRASNKLYAFYTMMEELAELKDQIPVSELIQEVWSRTGYMRQLEEKGDPESLGRIDNLQAIKSYALGYEQENGEDATLDSFLEEVTLTESMADSQEQDAVSLMTVHSAKGLEFPVVFLYGMEENLFPSGMSMDDPEQLEEERRLMYVAVTRAKQRLFMTTAYSRILYGRTVNYSISRFVSDIPAQLVDHQQAMRPRNIASHTVQSRKAPNLSKQTSMFGSHSPSHQPQKSLDYAVGQQVKHPTFGVGMIISVKKMGNDCYLEISFESVGTKKLMANYARLQKL